MKKFAKILFAALLCALLGALAACAEEAAENPLRFLSVDTENVKTEFSLNEPFVSDGLIVRAHYLDGTIEEVEGYTVSAPDLSSAGEKDVVVSYEDKTVSYPITVSDSVKTLLSLSVDLTNAKTAYQFGVDTAFTAEGLVVYGNFSDGSREEIANYTVNEDELRLDSLGTRTVVVSYQGLEVRYEIAVSLRTLQSVTVDPAGAATSFDTGANFTAAGLRVTAHYNFAPTEEDVPLTSCTFGQVVYWDGYEQVLPMSEGALLTSENPAMQIRVTYAGKTADYFINVHAPVLLSVRLDDSAVQKQFSVGAEANADGLKVYGVYSNGREELLPATAYTITLPDLSSAGDAQVVVTVSVGGAVFVETYTVSAVAPSEGRRAV